MTRQLRAALYLRLSVSKDDSTSLTVQEKDLRARAAAEGWEVLPEHVICEDGVSGAKNHTGTARALDLLRRGEVDVLLAWKFDRWSRAGIPALGRLMEVLAEVPGARFVTVKDSVDSAAPFWGVIASILATIAEQERENVRTRVRASIAERVTVGRWTGGPLPYGYMSAPNPDGSGRVLVHSPAESAIVTEAAERILNGESVYAVVRDLNDREVPTRHAVHKTGPRKGQRREWTVQALTQILTADTALGRVTHHGQLFRDDETGLPAEVWPPLFDLETFHRLANRLRVRKPISEDSRRRRRARSNRLLSGVVSCGMCGAPLYPRSNGGGTVGYACSARSNGRTCAGVSVTADLLDAYVRERFLDEIGHLEIVERMEIVADDVDLAEIERAMRQVKDAMDADDADLASLAAQLGALKAQRAEITSRPKRPTVRLVPTGETYAAAWERMSAADDVEGLRALLAPNVAILCVTKGRRGAHGLDASRVTLVTQPVHVSGVQRDEAATSGRVVVMAEGSAA
ncbi:site-specific recombinase [Intrasporangium oryzae NRRL B-24470]|uniref:Site-specific recombinase n=1 Tax=Intrasporangium oryzae NRRL B-24470 TaxID=1386089 RepID=W9G619_9MICO|nr:recombinase family protein [Intrasporangium oryzae]EWT00243.1 site-specific recombinase [Intrasporangium oryzae NRRL B-24470]